MENVLKQNNYKFTLIGKIKGLSSESRKARNLILKSNFDPKKWELAYRKYIVGIDIRHHLLAYAFLKGKPYSKLEQNCRQDNKPSIELIFKIIEAHAPRWIPFNPITKTGGTSYNVSLADVNIWLTKGVKMDDK